MRDQIINQQSIRRAPAIVRLPAEIDISNVQHVLALLRAVYAAGATVVVADLTATVFCDTTGLHALMKIQRQASADGAQLRLAVSPGGPVHRVLEMMGVDRLMPVYTSRDEAVALVRPDRVRPDRVRPGGVRPGGVRPGETARTR